MTHIVAVANQKGGVGKTTTAVNVGAALAAAGHSVWLVDLDPQGNATTSLGCPPADDVPRVLLGGEPPEHLLRETPSALLKLLAGGPHLAGFESGLGSSPGRERRLADILAAINTPPDVIMLDCPPSIGLLTTNALIAASSVLIPVQCEFLALQGLGQVLGSIEHVRQHANPNIQLLGIALTMHDRRNNLSEQVAANIRAALPGTVFEAVIPRNVRASEAPSHGLPVLLYDVRSPSSQAYIALTAEILARLEQQR